MGEVHETPVVVVLLPQTQVVEFRGRVDLAGRVVADLNPSFGVGRHPVGGVVAGLEEFGGLVGGCRCVHVYEYTH